MASWTRMPPRRPCSPSLSCTRSVSTQRCVVKQTSTPPHTHTHTHTHTKTQYKLKIPGMTAVISIYMQHNISLQGPQPFLTPAEYNLSGHLTAHFPHLPFFLSVSLFPSVSQSLSLSLSLSLALSLSRSLALSFSLSLSLSRSLSLFLSPLTPSLPLSLTSLSPSLQFLSL